MGDRVRTAGAVEGDPSLLRRYFQLRDDMTARGRWILGAPSDEHGLEIDASKLRDGEPVSLSGPIHIPIRLPGRPLDFSHLVTTPVPAVTEKVADVFRSIAGDDVQMFPATVEGRPGLYYLVNACKVVKCIDEERSEDIEIWQPEDERPDKVGQYRGIFRMRIDPRRVGDEKVFRPWGWKVALVVAEELKDALDRIGATGTDFTEV